MLPPMPDEYFTVRDLARYSKLSERQVWKFLALPPGEALPAYRPGRKVLVKRSEFDAWFTRYRMRGRPALVEALRSLGLEATT
jgi:excisionase family DNA binding protein